MKNDQIINAYDSINPTPVQKEKMLQEILRQADFSGQPEQRRRKREPIIYTATPTKVSRKSIFATIAASIALMLVSAAVLVQMIMTPEVPAYAEPTQTGTKKEFPAGPTKYPVYNAIIADFSGYLDGSATDPFLVHWGLEQLILDNDAEHTLGWALRDLDSDGTEELLFTDGWMIYTALSLFEEEGGGAPVLFTSSVQDRYYLCQDNVIMKIYDYSPSEGGSQYEFFKVDMDTPSFQKLLEVAIPSPEGWRIGKTEETAKPVDEETGKWTAEGKYPLQAMAVTLLRTKEDVAENGRKLTDYQPYQDILGQYVLAVEQRWDAEKLQKEGMSPLIAENDVYDRLGWCIMDHNSNGSGELVISDGEIIYDLYQTTGIDSVSNVITSDADTQYRMCEIRLYRKTTVLADQTMDQFFTLSEGERKDRETVICQDGEYFIKQGMEDTQPVSAKEAESVFFSHPTVYAPIQMFDPKAAGIEQLSGIKEYDSVLRLYAQSVEEQWDIAKYEQHGLSTMVAENGVWRDLGWCLLDIDANGMEELLICKGERIYDLYTIQADGIRRVTMSRVETALSRTGTTHALCQNGILSATRVQGDGQTWFKRYYRYQEGVLTEIEVMSCLDNEYYRQTPEGVRQPITKDEAGEIMSRYIELELFPTRFQPLPEEVYNTDATYAQVLQKYRKALTEKWNYGKCEFRGISGDVSDYVKDPGSIGYAFSNLDGGEEELIVTNGEIILALYTVRDGTVELVCGSSMRREYTLTENNEILSMQSENGDAVNCTLYRLINPAVSEENGLVVQEAYLRETTGRGPGPWHFSPDGETFGEPCGDFDVESRLKELAPVTINFRRFN